MTILIDKEKCTLCGACVSACPAGAITLTDQVEIDRDACLECGLCIKECPTQALSFDTALKTAAQHPKIPSDNKKKSILTTASKNSINRVAGNPSRQRGSGKGRGAGFTSKCLCLNCNKTFPHQRGVPCADMTCPQCGGRLVRGDA